MDRLAKKLIKGEVLTADEARIVADSVIRDLKTLEEKIKEIKRIANEMEGILHGRRLGYN
jgi:tetrahydromethanopterin S-methyltransferase subunit B